MRETIYDKRSKIEKYSRRSVIKTAAVLGSATAGGFLYPYVYENISDWKDSIDVRHEFLEELSRKRKFRSVLESSVNDPHISTAEQRLLKIILAFDHGRMLTDSEIEFLRKIMSFQEDKKVSFFMAHLISGEYTRRGDPYAAISAYSGFGDDNVPDSMAINYALQRYSIGFTSLSREQFSGPFAEWGLAAELNRLRRQVLPYSQYEVPDFEAGGGTLVSTGLHDKDTPFIHAWVHHLIALAADAKNTASRYEIWDSLLSLFRATANCEKQFGANVLRPVLNGILTAAIQENTFGDRFYRDIFIGFLIGKENLSDNSSYLLEYRKRIGEKDHMAMLSALFVETLFLHGEGPRWLDESHVKINLTNIDVFSVPNSAVQKGIENARKLKGIYYEYEDTFNINATAPLCYRIYLV